MSRTITIFLALSLLLSLIGYYFILNTTPIKFEKLEQIIQRESIPQDSEEELWAYVDSEIEKGYIFEYLSNEAYIVVALLSFSVFFTLTSIHLLIDKLFFKKFFQKPSMFNACRRSAVLILSFFGFSGLYLINSEWYVYTFFPVLVVLLEIIFSSIVNPTSSPQEE